jgi:hypothetical protein
MELLRRYYARVDAMDVDGCTEFFTEDARLQIGNNRPINGRRAIAKVLGAGLRGLRGIRHEIINAWEVDDNLVIFEVEVTYALENGRDVTITGAAVCLMDGAQFAEQRIYADMGAVSR